MHYCTRAEQSKPEGLTGFGNSSPCYANESLSPIRFAEEEQHISPVLNKPWWETTGGFKDTGKKREREADEEEKESEGVMEVGC